MTTVEVNIVPAPELVEPLKLLEESLRDGEPLPDAFVQALQKAVAAGALEIFAARIDHRVVGVAVLGYRLNISAGGRFASIEDLFVRTESRRQGVGRALLEVIGKRCATRGISYVEAQVEDDAAPFYAAVGYEPEPGVRVFSRSHAL